MYGNTFGNSNNDIIRDQCLPNATIRESVSHNRTPYIVRIRSLDIPLPLSLARIVRWLPSDQPIPSLRRINTSTPVLSTKSTSIETEKTCFFAKAINQDIGSLIVLHSENLILTTSQDLLVGSNTVKKGGWSCSRPNQGSHQLTSLRMRSQVLTVLLLPLSISALQIPSILAPFYEALLDTNDTSIGSLHDLVKRDGNCPTNYNSCSTLAAADAGACCTVGSVCTTDRAKNIACCPTGATCTGTVIIATSTGGVVLGGTTATTTGSVTSTTTTPASTTSTASTATITSAASLVDNSYFPFPYIPTTYSNSAACLVAWTDCQSNYAACTAELEGGAYAVTIVAPAGGVTVSPTAQNLGTSSAVSICSSLSNVACYGLQSSICSSFGAATFVAATGTSAPGSRITAGCYAGMVVAGLGIAGQLL
jgi:hypothetical protein